MATHAHYPGEFGYKPRKSKVVGGKIQKRDKIAKVKAAQAKHRAMAAKKKAAQQKRYEGFTAKQKKLGSKVDKSFAKSDKKKKAYDAKRDKLVGKIASAKSETKKAALRAKLKAHEAKKNAHHDSTAKAIEHKKKMGDALQKKKDALRAKMNAHKAKSEAKDKKFDEKLGKKGKASDGQKSSDDAGAAQKTKPAVVKKTKQQRLDEENAKLKAKHATEVEVTKSYNKVYSDALKETPEETLHGSMKFNQKIADHMDAEFKMTGSLKAKALADEHRKEADKIKKEVQKNPEFYQKQFENVQKYDGISESFASKITSEEKASLNDYTFQGDGDVNGFLRGNAKHPPRDAKRTQPEYIAKLDAGIRKHQIESDMAVYRGVSGGLAEKLRNMSPGQSFQDLGFTSTSVSPKTAKSFADDGDASGSVMVINLKKGQHAAPVGAMSKYPHEKEYLLPRGGRFTVTRVDRSKIPAEVHLEVSYD